MVHLILSNNHSENFTHLAQTDSKFQKFGGTFERFPPTGHLRFQTGLSPSWYPQSIKVWILCRVVNGPTSSGPNPKIKARTLSEPENYFEAQIMPEKTRKLSYCRSEKFSNLSKLFWLYFFELKTKSMSQAPFKTEIFVNFRPEPDPKRRPDLQL